ncbi:hypothetical protein [Puia sp.]|uniref:hypothetical protein n=1 Tax=Puia sp. TaxID=2045100 RepID=UPI002F3EE7C4
MKKVMLVTAALAASLIATKSYSQVYVNAHVGVRLPGVRVYVAPAPVYTAPAPVYSSPAPVYNDPAYDGGYYAPPATCEAEFPGYVYYDYPAWGGHYRDRVYYSHYRPYFERDHRAYFNGGRFDHARWERQRYYARPGAGHRRW